MATEYIKYIQDLEKVSRPVKDAELTEALKKITEITLSASGWSSSFPYIQSVAVTNMTEDSTFDIGILYPEDCSRDTQKAINKAAGLIYEIDSEDGTVTFRATEKPETDITYGIRGIVS